MFLVGQNFFQLYIHKDKSITDDLIERCSRANFDGMCITVDTLVAGNRERDHRTGFTTPPKFTWIVYEFCNETWMGLQILY